MSLRALKYIPLSEAPGQATRRIVLEAEQRRVRRKLWHTLEGLEVLVDLPLTVFIEDGDHLELDDGTFLEVSAADEDLYEITGSSPAHVAQLAWQIGNRHLSAQIEYNRILIKRDHVIRAMLIGLFANVSEIREQFEPLHGAYHGH